MKPRLKKYRGWWYCGIPGTDRWWWSCAREPGEAFELWARFRETDAAAVSAAKP